MKTRHEELNKLIPVHTTVSQVEINGEKVFRVTKKDKIMQFDENTIIKLENLDFHNGIIRVKMLVSLDTGNAPKNTPPRTEYAFSVYGHLTRLARDFFMRRLLFNRDMIII